MNHNNNEQYIPQMLKLEHKCMLNVDNYIQRIIFRVVCNDMHAPPASIYIYTYM